MAKAIQQKVSPVVDAIREEVTGRGLTAYKIAQSTGLGHQAVRRVLKGEGSPTISTLDAIANALGLEIIVRSTLRPRGN